MTRVTLPGLLDVHVHLRVPGDEHKETVETGTAAALAGGYVAVLGMPNTSPAIADARTLEKARREYKSAAHCDVGLYLAATDVNVRLVAAASGSACGLKAYVNETYGSLRIEDLSTLAEHFREWPSERPLVLHAEGLSAAAGIGLAAAYGRAVHIAHVSRADEIQLIAAAKEADIPVTCEVTPHHLFLTHDDLEDLGPFGEVRPRLASPEDRDALWEYLDVIDCIATDHAPHTRDEKESATPPPGMPGLETALPLMLTAVAEERLSLDRLVELMSTRPAQIFGIPNVNEGEIEVDLDDEWTLPDSGYFTKCDWSPFAGRKVRGRVRRVVLRGNVAWEDEEILVRPGYGRLIPESNR